MADSMSEITFEYIWEYRGDWFRMTVSKSGVVVFDNAHEHHVMPEEEVEKLKEALNGG